MQTFKFYLVDDDGDNLGFIPKDLSEKWESYRPIIMLAHDLLDHQKDEEGKIWQELRALGAFLFHCDFGANLTTKHNLDSLANNLSYDFVNISEDAYAYDNPLIDWTEKELNSAKRAVKNLDEEERGRFEELFSKLGYYYSELMESDYIDKEFLLEFNSDVQAFMVQGYVEARGRFELTQNWEFRELINKKCEDFFDKYDYLVNLNVPITMELDYQNYHFEIQEPLFLILKPERAFYFAQKSSPQ